MSNQSDLLDVPAPDKIHPWRICPMGQHYVKEHSLHTPSSKEHPEGETVIRHAHCADNPSSRDVLSYDELQLISKNHFSDLTILPKAGVLNKYSNADDFDKYIGGWVQYWNEIFKPEVPLDPNLVKALIASESTFKQNADTPQTSEIKNKIIGHARGLMQLTESTWRIITGKDHTGEIKDHFVNLELSELMDPSANICAGTRWLFTKKAVAKERLNRAATWSEAVAEYKGVLAGIIKNENPDPENKMQKFNAIYKLLKG
jgi:hypothetical protein